MPSLEDVAHVAGVSPATVSRVLNDAKYVKDETRIKVKKALKSLNFQPSRVARRLRASKGKSQLLGIILPDIQNPFYVEVIRGIEDYAYSKNYAMLLCNFAQNKDKEKLYLEIMKSESVDGMIVAPFDEHDKEVISLIKEGIPFVCVDRGLADINVDLIVVDNEKGAYDAVKLLIEKGHKKIAYIGGLPSIPTTKQRREGYLNAMRQFQLEINEDFVKFGDSSHESGKEICQNLLTKSERPTAIFTGNNLITLGALETIHSMNLKIPDDIAIIGFDDMPWSISLNPPLTAVRQPGYEIGKRAAELLYQRIMHPDRSFAKIVLNTELIIRSSC